MRIYYIFKIKDEYIKMYKDSPNTLYNILNQMYYMKKNELNYGYSLFSQIVSKINKFDIDKYLYVALHNKMQYVKRNEDHIINNLYKDEISVLKVKNNYILVNANKNYTDFFMYLNQFDPNFFVCDFNNYDYFFLSNINLLV